MLIGAYSTCNESPAPLAPPLPRASCPPWTGKDFTIYMRHPDNFQAPATQSFLPNRWTAWDLFLLQLPTHHHPPLLPCLLLGDLLCKLDRHQKAWRFSKCQDPSCSVECYLVPPHPCSRTFSGPLGHNMMGPNSPVCLSRTLLGCKVTAYKGPSFEGCSIFLPLGFHPLPR